MLLLRTLLLQSIVLSATTQLCAVAHGEPESNRQSLAFVNVNVVPMDSERVIANQTVLIQDGRIRTIGLAGRLAIPEAATRIDGTGKYLMPGLADMHVHVWYEDELPKFIANGVTTVRNMHGAPQNLDWKKRISDAEFLAPFMYTTGPLIDGHKAYFPSDTVVATSPELARQAVIDHKNAGYDFIKSRIGLTRETYDAIIDEAAKQGLVVVGHVPVSVGLEYAVNAGQHSIEHMDGIGFAAIRDDSPLLAQDNSMAKRKAWTDLDRDKLRAVAQSLAKKRTWVCPTLVFMQSVPMPEEAENVLRSPEFRFVRTDTIQMWESFALPAERVKIFQDCVPGRVRALKALHEAGVRLVLGTDSPAPFLPHGSSTLRELGLLVDAGLTPYEAIKMGTRNAADLVEASGEFGTVEVGGRADLLLLEANPLKAINNVATMVGVMLRGRWYPRAELKAKLEVLAEK